MDDPVIAYPGDKGRIETAFNEFCAELELELDSKVAEAFIIASLRLLRSTDDARAAQGAEQADIAEAFLWKMGTQHCLFRSLARAMARREADGGEVIPLYPARAAMSAQRAEGEDDAH